MENNIKFLILYSLFCFFYFLLSIAASTYYPFAFYDEALVVLILGVIYAAANHARWVFLLSSAIGYFTAVATIWSINVSVGSSFKTINLLAFIILPGQELIYRVMEQQRQLRKEKEALAKDLEKSLDNVRKLCELLPVCSMCNRLRTDEETWHKFENFLRKDLNAEIVAGVCEDCMQEIIGDFSTDENDELQ
ncbi:hypothetical protein GF373_09000 [bacterium]|nr:hypothetical protein [bacterium]